MGSLDEIGRALPALTKSTSAPDKIAYARDLWPRHHIGVRDGDIAPHRPGLVVWPQTPDEVATIAKVCSSEGLSLVPFGAGSGVCGGILPDDRTVVLDLKRMRTTRKVDRERGTIEVEAGEIGVRLEEDLAARGLTLGHFPSSILCSTVGGWVAARSAGQCSGKYGKIEDMVAALECVTATGEVVRLERRLGGPDLTPIVIGSEGVLAIVTAAELRVHPAPEARTFASFSFPTLEAGYEAMRVIFQDGLRPAVARLYDPFDSWMAKRGAVRRGRSAGRDAKPARPGAGARALRYVLRVPSVLNHLIDAVGDKTFGGATLVLVFEGGAAEGAEDRERARAIAERLGARDLGEEPARHWFAHRYSVSYRQAPVFMAGAFSDTMEVAAPWSRLDALYQGVRGALGRHVFVMAHLSHAYPDGCSIYFTFAGSGATRAASEQRYDEAWRAALDAAVAAGGTLSHHHGVGRSKAPRLGAELGAGVDVVRAIRRALDPSGILNPGNLLPAGQPAPREVGPVPGSPVCDPTSMLVHAAGTATLADIEQAAQLEGWTLGLGPDAPPLGSVTLDEWIAAGARGAPSAWSDPVDHLVAGFSARLPTGRSLEVRPSPRRAVGPDLFALFLGMGRRAGTLHSAHLRAHHKERRARELSSGIPRHVAATERESALIDRAVESVREVR